MNYDVPQAPPMDLSMSSSPTTMEPLLPLIPPINMKEPKESAELIDFKRVLTLDGKITGDIAEKFYQQSHQAEFSLQWQQCIYDGAPDYIKMREFEFSASNNLFIISTSGSRPTKFIIFKLIIIRQIYYFFI